MITITPALNIYNTNKNVSSASFKGSFEQEEPLWLDDFFVYRKANSEAKKILDSRGDIVRQSKVELQHALAIINARLKRVQQAVIKTPDKIKEFGGKKHYKEFLDGKLHSITTFRETETGIKIDRINAYNSDGSMDLIIADENNQVRNIHKNFRQIAPQSFIEDCGYRFEAGVLKSSNGPLSYVHDGVAKEKLDTREDVYRFIDGQLVSYCPRISSAGKDFYAPRIYNFQEGRLVGYAEDYTKLKDGFVDAKRQYDFTDVGFFA